MAKVAVEIAGGTLVNAIIMNDNINQLKIDRANGRENITTVNVEFNNRP